MAELISKIKKSATFGKKNFKINMWKIKKKIIKLEIIVRGVAHSICNLKYSVPKKIPIALHNESNCDYHFFIKKLAEEF